MVRKFALITLMSLTCLMSTPNKAKAYVPITEIILGVQLASALVVAAEPLIKIAFKAAKKGSRRLAAYIQRKRARPPEVEEEELLLNSYHRGVMVRFKAEDLDEMYFAAPAA